MAKIVKWGDRVPTRHEVLLSQKFLCLGVDGKGCPDDGYEDDWMTVREIDGEFRGICRRCFAKLTAKDRIRKGMLTKARKKAQLKLPLKNEEEEDHDR